MQLTKDQRIFIVLEFKTTKNCVVWALVCSIGDVCADVRVAAQTSLCTLGAQQPRPVLRALLHTCMQQPSPASCNNQENLEFEEHNLSVCCNVLLNGMTKTEVESELNSCTPSVSGQPGVLATLMSISQKVMVDCAHAYPSKTSSSSNNNNKAKSVERQGGAAQQVPLDEGILSDWLSEAVHQLTRVAATNTVRVAADNLLVTIASRHSFFPQVCDALLGVISNSSMKDVAWQSAVESLGNVCSSDPQHSVGKVAQLFEAMHEAGSAVSTDQARAVIAATVTKLAQTVAEAVAENDSKVQQNSSSDKENDHEDSVFEKNEEDVSAKNEDDAINSEVLDANSDMGDDAPSEFPDREAGQEMTLEQELNEAEKEGGEAPIITNSSLPDSPISDCMKASNDSVLCSDSTPEDGLTVDLNVEDLPADPHSVSDASGVLTAKGTHAVTLHHYSEQCDLIADTLVNQWLKSSNADLRNETIAAIGNISPLLSREKLEFIAPTVITTIISLYRKISLPYNLTSTLAQVLAAITQQEAYDCLKPHLDLMMGAVLTQASVAPSYSEPTSVSNHSEALRCCHLIALAYPAQMGVQLLTRLENASHVQRVAALVVTKHLIGCKVLSDDIIAGTVRLLSPILSDANTRVIRAVAQLILELCHNGHLDEMSAPTLVTYLVRHSAGAGTSLLCGPRGSLAGGHMSEETVGDTCSRALYLLTTTVQCAHSLLWPRLLTFLIGCEYETSLPTVLPCIAHLISRPHHSPQALPLLPLLPSLPNCVTPQMLVTRLLSFCAEPSMHPPLGGTALAVLGPFGGHLSTELQSQQWREQVEQLRRTCISLALNEQDTTALQVWQDTVRELLSQTLSTMADIEFTHGLVSAMLSEVVRETESERKLLLMGALGVALRHSRDSRLITDTLNSALALTNHKNVLEQGSLGVCVGQCAAGHTQLVVGLLAAWLKEADHKKLHSFMAMLKSDSGESSACVRGSVVMCLGQLCALTPHTALLPLIDGPIMLHLLNVINSNKHASVSSAVVETISCMCRSLVTVPKGFSLPQRPLLLTHLVNCCSDPPGSLAPVIAALRDLVLLEPVLEVEERTILLQAALNATHELITAPVDPPPPAGGGANTPAIQSTSGRGPGNPSSIRSTGSRGSISQSASATLKNLASAASGSALSTPRHSITSFTSANMPSLSGMSSRTATAAKNYSHDKVEAEAVEADALTGEAGKAFAQLSLLLRTIIQRDPTPAPLDDVTTLLQSWLLHHHTTVRSAAICLLLHALHTYNTHLSFPPQVAVNFHQTSSVLGALIPRLGDPCGGVRCGSVGCVVAVLRIAARYNAAPPHQTEEALQPLTDVQKVISACSGGDHEAQLRMVAQVLCRELSGMQLRSLVFSAAGGLQDRQPEARLAVAVLVAEVLKQRGHTLHYCCKQLLGQCVWCCKQLLGQCVWCCKQLLGQCVWCCKQLLDHVYGRLERVQSERTRAIMVEGLTHLAAPHLPLLADTLLGYPIPPHRGVSETWQALGCDPALVCKALTHLQQVVERTHAYTPQRTHAGYNVKVAAIQPLAALLGLTQLLHKLRTTEAYNALAATNGAEDDVNIQSDNATPESASICVADLTSPAVGGGVMADTDCTTPSSLATTATAGRPGSGRNSPISQPHPYASAREAVLGALPDLLATLLPRYGSYVGVLPPLHHTPLSAAASEEASASKPSMSSFVPNPGAANIVPARTLLGCMAAVWGVLGCSGLRQCLLQEATDVTHAHTLDTLTHTLSSTATLLVSSCPRLLAPLVMSLSSAHSERGERAAIAALYSQLVYEGCGGDYETLGRVTAVLLMYAQDVCPDVRRLALRGLSHYAHLYHGEVDDRLHEIIGALVGGTDPREETLGSIDACLNDTRTDNATLCSGTRAPAVVVLSPEERVCVEALRGLAALLPLLPPETVLPHTPLLLIRARLFAEKSSGEVREASFGVVRGLSAVVGDTQEFQEQLQQHLLAAVVHLADVHQPTVVMCKSALLSLSHRVSCSDLQLLLQTRLSPSASLDYKSFLAALAPLLVTWLGEQLSLTLAAASSYYHSRQPELRAAAAHLTGEVVRWGGDEGASGVATGLVLLMKDPEVTVRTAAATAAHLLSQHSHLL
ncbi:Armadillo-type fold [Trinorchestia longiramus]|nr:Armadillo-type fold [Trinorchestia longiramus]